MNSPLSRAASLSSTSWTYEDLNTNIRSHLLNIASCKHSCQGRRIFFSSDLSSVVVKCHLFIYQIDYMHTVRSRKSKYYGLIGKVLGLLGYYPAFKLFKLLFCAVRNGYPAVVSLFLMAVKRRLWHPQPEFLQHRPPLP